MTMPGLKMKRGRFAVVFCTLASAAFLAASLSTPAHSAAAQFSAAAGFADLIEEVQPAVVTVEVNKAAVAQPSNFGGDPRAEEFFERFFGRRGMPRDQQPRQAQGVGSGFIIDEAGYIVTNNHVVDGADSITVRLSDGRQFAAKVIGVDDKTDLALLKIDADKLTASELGNSDTTRVGDWVVAIGNPFGLGGTATVGIVSARGRDIRSGPYDDYMQIDAPINRGNSGGPVFNTDGEVVGVNTAIFSPNGGSVGIGFAIPANQVSSIVDELRRNGSVDRGWLGVQLQNIDQALADSLQLDSTNGTVVADVVEGSPAQRAGIATGDVIVEYDGEAVVDARNLSRLVGSSDSGDKVTLKVLRGDEAVKVNVVLGDAQTQMAASDAARPIGELGLQLAPLNDEMRQRLGVNADVSGVVVMKVDPHGPAADQGIRRGDILLQADRRPIASAADLEKALGKAAKQGRSGVAVLVKRGDSQQFASLPVG